MEQLGFAFPKLIWQIFNLAILLGLLAIPVWLVVKINSMDKKIKDLEKRLGK